MKKQSQIFTNFVKKKMGGKIFPSLFLKRTEFQKTPS